MIVSVSASPLIRTVQNSTMPLRRSPRNHQTPFKVCNLASKRRRETTSSSSCSSPSTFRGKTKKVQVVSNLADVNARTTRSIARDLDRGGPVAVGGRSVVYRPFKKPQSDHDARLKLAARKRMVAKKIASAKRGRAASPDTTVSSYDSNLGVNVGKKNKKPSSSSSSSTAPLPDSASSTSSTSTESFIQFERKGVPIINVSDSSKFLFWFCFCY